MSRVATYDYMFKGKREQAYIVDLSSGIVYEITNLYDLKWQTEFLELIEKRNYEK